MHQCGLTNMDFRTKGDFESLDRYQPNLKFTNFGTMGKTQYKRLASTNNFKEHVALTSGFKTLKDADPKNEAANMLYEQRGKKLKTSQQIGTFKEKELEDEKWTDKVFTGDNPKLTAFLSKQARDREVELNLDNKNKRPLQKIHSLDGL